MNVRMKEQRTPKTHGENQSRGFWFVFLKAQLNLRDSTEVN